MVRCIYAAARRPPPPISGITVQESDLSNKPVARSIQWKEVPPINLNRDDVLLEREDAAMALRDALVSGLGILVTPVLDQCYMVPARQVWCGDFVTSLRAPLLRLSIKNYKLLSI